MRGPLVLLGLLTVTFGSTNTPAQWSMEDSGTTADLRGISNVGGGVAWASGTNGTVLRTEDGGYLWQPCTVPPGAEHLDFRGIQAFDANTAIVMSSGKGDLSRLYKTTDGCQTWKLAFTNPDKNGFWDAMLLNRFDKDGDLLGDPVNGRFALWETVDKGTTWTRTGALGLDSLKDEGAFAASNSALFLNERFAIGFVTGGQSGPRVFVTDNTDFAAHTLPLRDGSQSAGGFSVDDRDRCCWVAVGGDYTKPNDSNGTAAYTHNGGKTWHAAQTLPHGYRSAVAYDAATKAWITVGPNGTDISADDGRNWRALYPDPALHEPADADRDWNALSLPFVVGPHGRIGKLNSRTFSPPALVP
jgi:photosystem II stability/assembly factor-like uncharacterized protein